MRPWHLAETNYGDIRKREPFEVAVLPFGATEPHNLHLPYGTDTFQVDVVADQACAIAFQRGAKVIRLPSMPYGTETNQMGFSLAMNLNPTTVLAVLTDLVESLRTHGIHKCVILNGHGGNEFKGMLRQLYGKTNVHLFACNWYKMAADRNKEIFDDPGDHAGELETSMILAHHPDLVRLATADAGTMAKTRFEAVNKGWIEMTRPWHLLTTNSGAGDPKSSTAEKGRAITEIVVGRLADFLVELSATPVDERFPY
jgi:creatinine amidohydrolase